MKHKITGPVIKIQVSDNMMKFLRENFNQDIDFNKPYSCVYLHGLIFPTHAKYDDYKVNQYLCPLLDLLSKDFNRTVFLKEYI